MCKFYNLRPSPDLAESNSFCQIGSPQHLLEELFRQDNLIDIREQCKNHEDTLLPLVNDRICFNTIVYHEARIDGEEPFDHEWECEVCNAFVKAGNWFGRTWKEIVRDERPDLNEMEAANDENIDTFSNSGDEELDVEGSEMNKVVSFLEELPENATIAALQPEETTPRKRLRSPSVASYVSDDSTDWEATDRVRKAPLTRFERPSKRIKVPCLTTKPVAPARARSASPPTGAPWPKETHRFSVGAVESQVPTLFLRPRQPARTELRAPSTISTDEGAAPTEASHTRILTTIKGMETSSIALLQLEPVPTRGSRSNSRPNILPNISEASSNDKGKGKARVISPERDLKDECSASIRVKQEAEAHKAAPSTNSQNNHISSQLIFPASTWSPIKTEIEEVQAGLLDALNDDLLNGSARSAINVTEDPGSEEVINAAADGSFLCAITDAVRTTNTPTGARRRYGWIEGGGNVPGAFIATDDTAPADGNQGGLAPSPRPSLDVQSSSKVDSQSSKSSCPRAAESDSSAPIDAVSSPIQCMKATILHLRDIIAAQSDRIAKLLAEKQEGMTHEIQVRDQMMELEEECERLRGEQAKNKSNWLMNSEHEVSNHGAGV